MVGVFRAYDIRGVFREQISPQLFFKVGVAFGDFIGTDVFVGGDARLSSPCLKHAFASGILASGCDCVDVGMVATPIIYFASTHYGPCGGAMITASHNPPEYNGVKLCKDGVSYSYETYLKDLEEKVGEEGLALKDWKALGAYKIRSVLDDYAGYVLDRVEVERRVDVVIDFGNGSSGFAAEVFEKAGCRVQALYKDPDGRFPNHIPDPVREDTLGSLKEAVMSQGADLGFAFDGDGDRVGFIDDRGRMVKGDDIFILLSRDVLERNPGCKIIATPLSSKAVFEDVEERGGKLILARVGHSYVHERLVAEGALLAGEISGHYYIADGYYGFDDAIFAALRVVGLLSRTGVRFSDLVDKIPHYASTSEVRIRCPDELKFQVVEAVKAYYVGEGYETLDVDGVRVEFEKGWGLVRASNTEPAVVLRFEAEDESSLNDIRKQVMGEVEKKIKIDH